MSMFCYQCQETAKGTGCTIAGVCGKKEGTSNLQDLLIYTAKSISILREGIDLETREACGFSEKLDYFITNALFVTITNANFDDIAIAAQITKGLELRDKIKAKFLELGKTPKRLANHDALTF
ncbi:MAG: hydroxylamine reductase, partial [Psychrilyobacter sp.]|nr:hydroxylamine reductase [Psychrilyobacter sp.]